MGDARSRREAIPITEHLYLRYIKVTAPKNQESVRPGGWSKERTLDVFGEPSFMKREGGFIKFTWDSSFVVF